MAGRGGTTDAFPPTFLFGVATADHQCEAFDPRYPDIRDVWETNPGQTPRGRATDFWNRYQEDIKLAAELGCTMFRFSVSWARVEPSPGVFNQQTWGWDGSTWSLLADGGPSGRSYAAMTYDSDRGRVVLGGSILQREEDGQRLAHHSAGRCGAGPC